jgi:hypothetical protein
MKFIFVLSVIFTLVSCGATRNGQLRLVKVNNHEIAVIEKNTKISQPINQEAELSTANIEHETIQNHTDVITSEKPFEFKQTKQKTLEIPLTKKIEPEPTDTIKNKDIEQQALEAEKKAKLALGFSIGGLSIIVPFLSILGIISFILASVFYSKANNARYITPEGQQKLKISKGFLIAESILIGIIALIIIIVIIALIISFSGSWF